MVSPSNHERERSSFDRLRTSGELLRVAVIGVGHLGQHHARILGSLPGVALTAVVDVNRSRADTIAAANRTRAVYDAGDLEGQIDAVTVAVPTERHRELAAPFLEAGVPVLVEKPLARTVGESDVMIDLATRGGAIL